jgi:hypothetical protein
MKNPRFQVRTTEEKLEELADALTVLGYTFGADNRPDFGKWFEENRLKAIESAKCKK